jgi:hypothetical protein
MLAANSIALKFTALVFIQEIYRREPHQGSIPWLGVEQLEGEVRYLELHLALS